MAVKLAGVILALSIELVGVILALSIEVLAGVILALLLKKPCAGGRAGRCHPRSINRSAGRCHPRTTIESHLWRDDGSARLSRVCSSWGLKAVTSPRRAYAFRSVGSNIKGRGMQMLKQKVKGQQ